ncbi:MAG TPA: hypothetical protein VFA83_10430 [Acidimicrobiales bacterium]|nr:hypothetical protein [Acidimicrobiales bacterium]
MAPDPQHVGDRIETQLRKLRASLDDPTMTDVEEVLSLLTTLYGAGLARIVDVLKSTSDGDRLITRLTEDKLVSTLLVLHDLHPELRASDFDPPPPAPVADVWTPVHLQTRQSEAGVAGSFA